MRSTRVHRIPGFSRIALLSSPANAQVNIDYCSKTDTRIEGLRGRNGNPAHSVQARQNPTRARMVQQIKAGGMTSKKIIADYPLLFLHGAHNIEKMIQVLQEDRNFAPKVKIYFGETGCGKSWKALRDHPGAYHVKWPEKSGTWWWDYYDGGNAEDEDHDTVIMDEFRHNISYGRMLALIDRGPFKIQYKGGMSTMNSHTIVITTNIEPMNWYPAKDQEGFSMLRRRFNDYYEIYDFTLPNRPEWQPGYSGDIEKRFTDIRCIRRTQPVQRTVGPTPQVTFTRTMTVIPAGTGDVPGNGFLDFNMEPETAT